MNLLAALLAFLFLTNCGTKNKTSAQKSSSKPETKTEAQTPASKVTISGTVTQTSSYCGGAAPPKFLLEQLAEPKQYPNKKLHVIKGDTNIV